MWQPQFAAYLGKEEELGFFGFLAETNFFLVLTAEGVSHEKGKEILQTIKKDLAGQSLENLASFEAFLNSQIKKNNLPAGFSLAVGYLSGDVFYLKTVGEGKIFLRRKNNFQKIIEKEMVASGYIKEGDFFIFTNSRFTQLFGEEQLKEVFDHKTPYQIIEELAPQMKMGNDQGSVALFVRFLKEKKVIEEEEVVTRPSTFYGGEILANKKERFTLLTIIVILIILVWSVGLGYKRRKEEQIDKKIRVTKELITQKLNQAEEIAFLNLPRSLILISEAKQELQKIKKEIGDKRKEGIRKLEELVKEKENRIIKKEKKDYEEFFDLTVDDKKASGIKLHLDEDNLIILDQPRGIIYSLSLTKKSLEKNYFKEIKKAQLIANYQNDIFFFVENEGVYKIEENKLKKVIEKDSDWGKIIDLWIYNGNIYLLDSKRDQVYKYLVTEKGYSGKTSYFKAGEAIDLEGVNSMAIDSSIYLGFKDHLVKYSAGVQEEFKTAFPEKDISLIKIFTSKEAEKVYSWDKDKGMLFVLAKNGTYEREINSSILSKATDLVVFKNTAYLLMKEKIYKISVE